MPDAFIASDHKHLKEEQELYASLRKEGYTPRFVDKVGGTGLELAKKRATTNTYLLCQDIGSREDCELLTREITIDHV